MGLGHRSDCHAYLKLDQNSSLNSIIPNRWLCFDRTPTGMLSITADVHDITQPLDYAKQVCSLVPDATVQRSIGSFLVAIMEDTQQPTGINASCNYTLRVGRLTGEVKTAIFPVPFDQVDSGCTGTPEKEPDGLSLRAFTVAGVRGTVNGPSFSSKDEGNTQTWDYRLPVRLVNGDAICQESKVELEYQPGSFGGKGGIVSPAHFNSVSQRLVADLAVALKPKAR
ncbi:hypothetical protein [uncultured Jatrophihabitans sp.]|uniref:hypothetical protein n=1 Tax=uncultured Jatrophihabitans sp. TaxID=1610747 RepID=UPI0035CC650F